MLVTHGYQQRVGWEGMLGTPLMLWQHTETYPQKVWVLQEGFWQLVYFVLNDQQSEKV